jgi:hypothetical protein
MIPVMVAITAAQAISGFMGARSAAKQAQETAAYNAAQTMAVGMANADNTENFAEFNADRVNADAKLNVSVSDSVSAYNAKVTRAIAGYNASLLDSEVERVWQDAELDMNQYSKQGLQQIGHQVAAYGASGVMLGDGQSLDQSIIDSRNELDMDMLIMAHNAESVVGRLLDEKAKGQWQGEMAAKQIEYEGQVNSFNITADARSKTSTILAQGYYDASTQRTNAVIGSNSALYGGSVQADAYKTKANQALLDGAFKIGSMYAGGGIRSTKE